VSSLQEGVGKTPTRLIGFTQLNNTKSEGDGRCTSIGEREIKNNTPQVLNDHIHSLVLIIVSNLLFQLEFQKPYINENT
jgi:hypothetical protein